MICFYLRIMRINIAYLQLHFIWTTFLRESLWSSANQQNLPVYHFAQLYLLFKYKNRYAE